MKDLSDTPPRKVEWRDLEEGRRPSYNEIKKKFNPESLKGRAGFSLSELVANQLSVEEEEKNRFEKRVVDEVDARLSVIKAEAQQKGFVQGEEDGRKKAFEEEKARLAALMEKLSLAISNLSEEKITEQYDNILMDVTFRLAEVILHTHIDEKPEAVKATIRAVLDRISREDDVRVKLSTHSFEGIQAIEADLKTLVRDGRITFELDAGLPKGACVVESQSGEYASFIEEKLKILREEIMHKKEEEKNLPADETKVG